MKQNSLLPVFVVAVLALLNAQNVLGEQAEAEEGFVWRNNILQNTEAFRLLFKRGTIGNNLSEVRQWRGVGSLSERELRITQLQSIIRNHRRSPYVDDASLLLARAYFLYDGDSEKAINGLYDVIKTFPKDEWIAEDPIVLSDIAVLFMGYGIDRMAKATKPHQNNQTEYATQVEPYMNYISQRPTRTSDEAKVWIAWIILQANLEPRFGEAEQLLRGLVDQYRESDRTQLDIEEASRLENELIRTVLPRSERTAHQLLIDLLRREGRQQAVQEAVADYARLYEGHGSVDSVVKGMQ